MTFALRRTATVRRMAYELHYWPTIQGRGEFVRLALEAAGAPYIDVARGEEDAGLGMSAMLRCLHDKTLIHPPFAPPFLKDGNVVTGIITSQTDQQVTMKNNEGLARTIPRSDIEELQKQNVSLMPADLYKLLSQQDLVDVVEYLLTLQKK